MKLEVKKVEFSLEHTKTVLKKLDRFIQAGAKELLGLEVLTTLGEIQIRFGGVCNVTEEKYQELMDAIECFSLHVIEDGLVVTHCYGQVSWKTYLASVSDAQNMMAVIREQLSKLSIEYVMQVKEIVEEIIEMRDGL